MANEFRTAGLIVTGSTATIGGIPVATTDYVDEKTDFSTSALDYITDNTVAPPTEVLGDRYILSHGGGAPHANYDGASAGDIVRFDGTVWQATTPTDGTIIYDEDSNQFYIFENAQWRTLADGTFLETVSGQLRIKDDGVTLAKMADIIRGSIIVGGVANAPTALDAKTAGQVLIGDGTDIKSLAVSGDATMAGTGALTIAADAVSNTKLANITRGSVKVGGVANAPTDLDAKTSGQILVGDGTDILSVAVSGDATLAANGALTIAADAVSNTKLANIARGSVKVGGVADAPTDLDAKTDGYILVGDGTDVKSVAVSGDVTLANTGAVTIAALAVETGMINDLAVTNGKIAANTIVGADKFSAATLSAVLDLGCAGRAVWTTADGLNPTATETLTIGADIYEFGGVGGNINVTIGVDLDATLTNFVTASAAGTEDIAYTNLGGGDLEILTADAPGGTIYPNPIPVITPSQVLDVVAIHSDGHVAGQSQESGVLTFDAVNTLIAGLVIPITITPRLIMWKLYAATGAEKATSMTVVTGAASITLDPTAGATPPVATDVFHFIAIG